MSLKLKMYLEFLQRMPSGVELDEYRSTLAPANKDSFDQLMLFNFYGMKQLAKERKLVGIGDMYFTLQGLGVMVLAIVSAVSLNRFVFQFNLIGFSILFGLLALAGWSFVVFYKKHFFYVNRSSLWSQILMQYSFWLNREPDEFVSTLNEHIENIPKQKQARILNAIRNQLAR